MATQLEGWKQTIESINKDGQRAWAKAHKQWLEEKRQAREHGQDQGMQTEPKFTVMDDKMIWKILKAKIDGLAHICGEVEGNTIENPRWTVQDLYQGLTPKGFTSEWKSYFKTSTSIARYMVGRFVKAIEEFGRTEIWNKRCKVTVDWERENEITSMSKRAKGRNCAEGHRRSGSNFIGSTLRHRPAAGVKDTRTEADERIVKSYLGQLDLNVMERLDS
ncbi:hypothetical protein BGX26_008502, partial [Mortierella sp. AD094]